MDKETLSDKVHDLRNLVKIGKYPCNYYTEKDVRSAVQKILERIDEGIDEHLKENLEEFESRKKTLLNLKFKKVIDGLIVGLAENHKKIIKSLVGEDLI